MAACLAASSLHPRSRFELFQILCIDVNLCILLTAVSLRYQLLRRYERCLLILDRCEDAIRQRSTQFIWFLSQLLQQSSRP